MTHLLNVPSRRPARLIPILAAFLMALLPLAGAALAAPGESPQHAPKAFVCLVIDDTRNLDLWTQLADDFGAQGIPTTLAVDTNSAKPEDWVRLKQRIDQGHEVASHTRGHVSLGSGEILNVRYFAPGTTSAKAEVDVQAKMLRVYLNGATNPALELDTAPTGPNPTLGKLADTINKRPGFAAAVADARYTNIRSEFLDRAQSTDILYKAGFAPLFLDQERHLRYELGGSKQDIEANIPGYVCDTIVYPFLVSDSVTPKIAQELGYKAGRTGVNGTPSPTSKDGFDPFRIWAQTPRAQFGEPSAPDFEKRVQTFIENTKKQRGAVCLYSHGANEYSTDEWRRLVQLLRADPDVRLTTIRDMVSQLEQLAAKGQDGRYRIEGK